MDRKEISNVILDTRGNEYIAWRKTSNVDNFIVLGRKRRVILSISVSVGFSRRNQVTRRELGMVRDFNPHLHVCPFPLLASYLWANDGNEFHRITINLDVIIINLEYRQASVV